jgi:hypothetical protein
MSATAEFLSKAAIAFKNKQGDILSQLVLPDLNDPDVELITVELLPVRQAMMTQWTHK